jgi:hypothetical protein
VTRALIGDEGGVPPILLVSRGGPWGWGVYYCGKKWRVTGGPMYGWCWERFPGPLALEEPEPEQLTL